MKIELGIKPCFWRRQIFLDLSRSFV